MRRTAVLRRAALPLLLLLLLHAGAFRGASADELADDDDDQLTLGEEPPPAPKGKRMPGDSEGVIREGQPQQQQEGEAPEAQKVEDPLKPAVMLALQKPALFGQRLRVHFEQNNEEAELVVHKGEVPLEVLGTFADENEMGEEEREMAARALARTQLELAWASEADRRAREETQLDEPALFNLTLSVRQDEQNETLIPVRIHAGQSPLQAATDFAAERGVTSDVSWRIANKLSEDQRQLAWEVAKEQFGADASVAAYLRSRVPQLQSVADLQALGAAITQRIEALTLFTLYVETPGTQASAKGPLKIVTHEGDRVEVLAADLAQRAGKAGDANWTSRVQGAIMVSFMNYKELRQGYAAENRTQWPPVRYWYDEATDAFKEPRIWEDAPPRASPLFQLSYEVNTAPDNATEDDDDAAGHQESVNVTVYEGDVAIGIGEQLARHYGVEPKAGWQFAHYVATSFRNVRERLNVSAGARPWEKQPPQGMALFTMDITDFEGIGDRLAAGQEQRRRHTLTVHEGDAPKGLARKVLNYHSDQRVQSCKAKGESSLGQCASKETEATLTNEYQARVTALSAAITKQFKVYF